MSTPISILLFGITRDLTGQSAVTVAIDEGNRVSDLLHQLYQEYPKLADVRSLLIAVNGEYAEADQLISSKDEIALIPPVSGG
ncbi:molybdopterin converting factor subunit 1 [Spirosoma terrae]|uniref:Molybdopterin synthase sulfur carrier subunit n=1 Tax=Spirosoma terrae TaxID=1968276 RepID=A0A6L9L6J8_9BACT|nr:molybdopterin converting factor subunit 1 [Spirosoma terrae]NDU94413.1 molybdopterin converting factor subunit 1 [Spirosoma terrae]